MSWSAHQLLALANLAACLGIAWACIGHLNSEVSRRLLCARLRYTLLLTGALASGLQPVLWGSWPGTGAVLFSLSVLIGFDPHVARWLRVLGRRANKRNPSPHPMRRKEDRQ